MGKKKIIRRNVKEGIGGGVKKISLFGFSSLFNKGPKLIPFSKTFYQKNTSGAEKSLLFSPKNYEKEDALERKKMAFEDAKNHKNFYIELIKKGVYPKGTTVKVKKKKHSNSYFLNINVPKIKMFGDFFHICSPNEKKEFKYDMRYKQTVIQSVAEKRGYNYKERESSFPTYYEDISGIRNYGIDSNGDVRYIDTEILLTKLPFKGRKKSEKEKRFEELKKKRSLESKLVSIIIFGGLIGGLVFLSPNLTGNIIANIDQASSNWIGGVLLLIGLFSIFFYFKKI